ncbi:MAG: hypothetical protein KGQ70_03685 [Alphaproteobacteria bacterium]|nr:hypothetical protein [Alphaproteobacteria bacterium]
MDKKDIEKMIKSSEDKIIKGADKNIYEPCMRRIATLEKRVVTLERLVQKLTGKK